MTVTGISVSSWPKWMVPARTTKEAIAACASSHLSKTLTGALNDQGNVEEELEALKEVHSHTSPIAIDTERYIAVVFEGEPRQHSSDITDYCVGKAYFA